ncbi:hypothetical protein FOL47_008753 [Perkinsus chesapeaki]|uniref:STAS domain-containing protein n=1 Tax=Perkinsus chesapeaki TaxID=330153 RepID=A0A7J6LC05_PERCH|nr:hypothetical protein FOL47_008753 [Perkinsus chesapeaki]
MSYKPKTSPAFFGQAGKLSRKHGSDVQLIKSLATPLLTETPCLKRDRLPAFSPKNFRRQLEAWIPLISVLKRYSRGYIKNDLMGGITLGLITLSQSIAHANIAHVGLINGPYSCVWPVLVYAIFGTSPHMSVGTGAMMALMTGEHVAKIPDLEIRTAMGCQLALITGFAMCLMAALRLSFLVRFISRPALSGFVTGAAFVIVASLMKDFFGLHRVDKGVNFFQNMFYVCVSLHTASPAVTLLSVLTIGIINGLARYRSRHRAIEFIAGFKELVAVIVATALCFSMSLVYRQKLLASFGDDSGWEDFIPHVGSVPSGLPSFQLPPLNNLSGVAPSGVMVALMCYISSFAAAKKFAIVDGYEIHAGTELGVMGVANVVGSVFGAFPVQGGLSRTSISHYIGVKTQVAGIVAALIAIGGLTFLTSLMYWIPNAALAGIIISATPHLTDFDLAKWLWRNSKRDFAVWSVAVGGTLLFGLLQGVFLAVVLSVTFMIQKIATPPTNAMGRLSNGHWRALAYWPRQAKTVPGLLVFGINGPLLFVNWEFVKDRLLQTERKYSRYCGKAVEAVVIQMTGVPFIDATAIQGLEELAIEFHGRGVALWFAGSHGSVRRLLENVLVEREIIEQKDLVQQVEAVVQQALRQISLPVTTHAAVVIQRWWRNRRQQRLQEEGDSGGNRYINALLKVFVTGRIQVGWAIDDDTIEEMYRNRSLKVVPSTPDLVADRSPSRRGGPPEIRYERRPGYVSSMRRSNSIV